MAERSSFGHGEFNWVDVMTRDTDSAKVFYSELFGLSYVDERHDDGSVYTLGVKGTRPVAGLMRQPDELCEMGMPPFWETYVNVDDVEAAAAGVAGCGGTLLGPVVDVPGGAGRMGDSPEPGLLDVTGLTSADQTVLCACMPLGSAYSRKER